MRSQGRLDVIDAIENWVSPDSEFALICRVKSYKFIARQGELFASYEQVSGSLEQALQRACSKPNSGLLS